MSRLAAASFALLTLFGCATTGDDYDGDEQDSNATQYVQIQDFTAGADDAWYNITAKLNAGFDQICGDTFCEGDYANITPLRVYCSVSSKVATIHDCAWTFTASTHDVDPATGNVSVQPVTYQCHFKPKTSGPKLIDLLSNADDALNTPLPGMGTIYEAIGDCFEHPIATSITFGTGTASGTTTPYVDAANYYSAAASSAKWDASLAALHRGFDDVCGDTFCGSDYSDVQALDLGCAITRSTGNVKTCVWNFGGSFTMIKKTGDLDLTSKTWSCPVAVHGTISQVISALTSTTDPEPNAIQRTLPGGTSAYDSILGCVTR